MSEIKALEKLRKSLKDCTNKAGVEPNQFDTYWITANACDMLIDELEAEIADNYMRLPCDADGVPIRVGDTVAEKPFRPKSGEKPAEVVCMLLNSDGWAIGDCDPRGHWYGSLQLEHVKPRTLEDVLNDFGRKFAENYHYPNADGLVDKTADEIRELMKEGGDD